MSTATITELKIAPPLKPKTAKQPEGRITPSSSKEELVALVRRMRERKGSTKHVEIAIENRDPAFQYKWVANTSDRINWHKNTMNAEIVRGDENSDFKQKDGEHRRGDTILMKFPVDEADYIKAVQVVDSENMVSGDTSIESQLAKKLREENIPIEELGHK